MLGLREDWFPCCSCHSLWCVGVSVVSELCYVHTSIINEVHDIMRYIPQKLINDKKLSLVDVSKLYTIKLFILVYIITTTNSYKFKCGYIIVCRNTTFVSIASK